MFGIGPQELVLIALLFLLIFGPGKLPSMARDFGRFVTGVNRSVEEFKSEFGFGDELEESRLAVEDLIDEANFDVEQIKRELLSEELKEPRRAVEEIKSELVASSSDQDEGGGEEPPSKKRRRFSFGRKKKGDENS